MNKQEIENKFLEKNPDVKKEDIGWRLDGRLEWHCEHGIGHTVYAPDGYFTHGCDGCCKKVKLV